jgi:hypothetical protein
MFRRCLLILLVLLVAPAAFAQDQDKDEDRYEEEYGDGYGSEYAGEEEDREQRLETRALKRQSRFSLGAGWRYAPNTTFFDTYYSRLENRGLARADGTFGGPLAVSTFAYSPLEWLELGIDMFFTYERMALTQKPEFNTLSFGTMLGLRVQKRFNLGPEGSFTPFVGVLSGPTFTASYFAGSRSVENYAQASGLTAGAHLRLSPKWGVCFEYRLTFANGQAEGLGVYDAGGSWLSVGLTYIFPKVIKEPRLKRGL